MKEKPKVKVYVDGANMFYVQKDIGFFIDWNKMKNYLSERYDILEVRYYVGVKNEDEKMRTIYAIWMPSVFYQLRNS